MAVLTNNADIRKRNWNVSCHVANHDNWHFKKIGYRIQKPGFLHIDNLSHRCNMKSWETWCMLKFGIKLGKVICKRIQIEPARSMGNF